MFYSFYTTAICQLIQFWIDEQTTFCIVEDIYRVCLHLSTRQSSCCYHLLHVIEAVNSHYLTRLSLFISLSLLILIKQQQQPKKKKNTTKNATYQITRKLESTKALKWWKTYWPLPKADTGESYINIKTLYSLLTEVTEMTISLI